MVTNRDDVVDDESPLGLSDPAERVSLRTLEERPERLSALLAIDVIIGVLNGLSNLHGRGFIHGDLTPEKILIDSSGISRLTLARRAAGNDGRPDDSAPRYSSPEATRGSTIDERSDVYSAGVILYEAVTGHLPFSGADRGAFPRSTGWLDLDLVIRRATAHDPAFRYSDCSRFAAELQDVRTAASPSENRSRGWMHTSSEPHAPSTEQAGDTAPPEPGNAKTPALHRLNAPGKKRVATGVLGPVLLLAVLALAGWSAGWPGQVFGRSGASATGSSVVPKVRAAQIDTSWSASTAPASSPAPTAPGPGSASPDFTPKSQLLSCPTSWFCVSLEDNASVSGAQSALRTYDSGTWDVALAPTDRLLPAPSSNSPVRLEAVSCPVARWCVAVGTYGDEYGTTHGLVETLANGSWSDSAAPGPGQSVSLNRVVCAEVGSCTAIGGTSSAATIWSLSSGTWSATAAPTDGLGPPNGSQYSPRLTDVSCASVRRCVAVGSYYSSAGKEQGLIETLGSGVWTASTAPPPSLSGGTGGVSLEQVSCPTAESCVSLGGYYDRLGYLHVLVERLSAGSWKSSTIPVEGLSLTSSSPQWMYPTSLACPSSGFCVATGWYFSRRVSDEVRSYVLTYSSRSWSAEQVETSQLGPPVARSLDVVPMSVSCNAPQKCVVVGTYYDAAGLEYGLIDTLRDRTWSSTTAPIAGLTPVSATDPGLQLDAVSCPTGNKCFAAGVYRDAAGDTEPVIEHGTG